MTKSGNLYDSRAQYCMLDRTCHFFSLVFRAFEEKMLPLYQVCIFYVQFFHAWFLCEANVHFLFSSYPVLRFIQLWK